MNQAFVVMTEDMEVCGIAHTRHGVEKAIADWYAKQDRRSLIIGSYTPRAGVETTTACGIELPMHWSALELDGTTEYFLVEATTHYFEA